MPYEISFTKPVPINDREDYINECCVGGDVVLEQLLPPLRKRYGDLEPAEEDWGWFVWFDHTGVKLAVDVFTDDADAGAFRMHLTSRKSRFLLPAKVEDTPELEGLRDLVVAALRAWDVGKLEVERVDDRYM